MGAVSVGVGVGVAVGTGDGVGVGVSLGVGVGVVVGVSWTASPPNPPSPYPPSPNLTVSDAVVVALATTEPMACLLATVALLTTTKPRLVTDTGDVPSGSESPCLGCVAAGSRGSVIGHGGGFARGIDGAVAAAVHP